MYRKVLLASDGVKESMVALREGALIAHAFGASAHLLIVGRQDAGRPIAEGVAVHARDHGWALLHWEWIGWLSLGTSCVLQPGGADKMMRGTTQVGPAPLLEQPPQR